MSDCKRFTQVAHDKWANERFAQIFLLKSYFLVCFIYVFDFKKWVIRSFPLLYWAMWNRSFFWANHSFAHFFAKNQWANSQPCLAFTVIKASSTSELHFEVPQGQSGISRKISKFNFLPIARNISRFIFCR